MSEKITLYVNEKSKQRLVDLAKARNISVSSYVKNMIFEHLYKLYPPTKPEWESNKLKQD